MKPQPVASQPLKRDRFRVQLGGLSSVRRHGSTMFGIPEILALIGAVMMLVIVIVGYFYFFLPSRSKVESLTLDRDRLDKELRFSRADNDRNLDTTATVQKITESLDRFEEHGLVERSEGRRGLYEDLNQLIHKNGLRNTSGPTYAVLEPLGSKTPGAKQNAGANNSVAKWQSIYPGISVSVTLEGQYQDLRHFVRDIETSKQFLIINAVELERAEGANARQAPEIGAPRSGATNTLVSLRIDLATYFQRAGAGENEPDSASKEH